MKMFRLLALLLVILHAAFVISAHAAPLSGTKSVGPTGNYSSLTAAIANVQANGLGGALVLELQPAYVSTVETFPLTIPSLNGASATKTLTIRPANGATVLSISSADTTAATVDLSGAQFVTIDGRPGGTGSNAGSGGGAASQLTIANTSTSGVAVRFINEASNNTLRYTTLRSVNTSAASGTVVFSDTTGANGNDNNTIDHCDIRDGASTPANGIYSFGRSSTTAQNNSGNTVSNCNVFNFYSGAVDAAGVRLESGNTDWNITGNSFYQTASRAATAANVRAIYVNNALAPDFGNNFTVTGNFIGGDSPGANVTTQKWTTTGTSAAYLFQGIQLNVGTTTPSSVQGNTIANIVWTTKSNATTLPGVWSGIYVQTGSVNIGTVTGNTIGSGTGTGSVSITTSGDGGTTFGIGSGTFSSTVAIVGNTIGSISVNGTTTSIASSLTGIQVTAGANTISNNLVGSTTTANSLNAANSSTSPTVGQQITGILSSSSARASTTGNTVANLNNNYNGTATTGQIRGIVTSGFGVITGNTVRNLSTTSANPSTTMFDTTGQSVVGIAAMSTAPGQAVSQNTVHSLANTATSAAAYVTGIYFAGPDVITRNLVHSLEISSSNASSVINGLQFVAGTFTAQNNMVRVGLDKTGNSTAGASIVRGIYDNGTNAGRKFYHNSVYIGGTQTSGASNTYALDGTTGVSNTRIYQNNIFANARGNSGTAAGKHYAVTSGGATVNPTGLTAGGNIFYASGTGGVLGFYNSADRTTLALWQAATGQDATSAVGDPLFVAPTGDASTVDLHLQASNPAERGGIALTDAATGAPVTVTDDFDGQTRSTLSPVDVGADAGNFTASPDLFPPRISYPLLTSGTTANRVLTGWATITDGGSVSGGANAPRLYFKKSTDADVFGGNTAADNGWKYVTTTTSSGSGPYSFTLDYSIINGGSVSAGDTVQYFVVAQDAANSLGSSPAGATASANPPLQNVNGHGAVNSFSIVGTFSGSTVTVGSGGTYLSLSGAGGLFAALNGAVLTGNVVVNITSDLTETGGVTLNEFNATEYPATGYTLTIQPDSATMRTISGTATAGLITLNGADRVTIDGRFGGGGRFLTFRNTSTASTASTILFINDASNNTVRNCVAEGASTSTTLGVIGFSTGAVTGNNNNLITGCQVRDLSTAAGMPTNLIGSTGSSTAVPNSGNTASNNELFNFNQVGIYILSAGNDSWTLSDNNIFEANPSGNYSVVGIKMDGGGTNAVTGNSIHDLLTTSTQSVSIFGIFFSGTGNTTIARNRITALNVNAATAIVVLGIWANGSAGSTLNVVNNQITLSPAASISTTLYGLYDGATSGNVVNVFHNSIVLGGTESGTASSWASYRKVANTHTARDNIFLNLRTGGAGRHFAFGSEITGGSLTVSNNVYAGTGATAANFMDYGSASGTAVPMSIATWLSTTGDTNSQAGIAGTGNFTTAMFMDAANGDLHLVPGGNVLVNNTGTPIAGVTTDYDSETRNATAPFIGADELAMPDIAVAQGNALADGAGNVGFGTVTMGGSSAGFNFTITNPGTADLTGLVITKGGANADDFTVSALGGTSVPVGAGSVTFTVTFTPTAAGTRNAAIHIASNVSGAKNPFDIALAGTGQTVFAAWAATNGMANNPLATSANGQMNLMNFAFAINPATNGSAGLRLNGTLAVGGTIGATGLPVAMRDGNDLRALFVRRKDATAAGLTYTPQFSADMITWNNCNDIPDLLADDGTNQIVSVSFPSLAPGQNGSFFRINVILAP